jgi:hypothetical protein
MEKVARAPATREYSPTSCVPFSVRQTGNCAPAHTPTWGATVHATVGRKPDLMTAGVVHCCSVEPIGGQRDARDATLKGELVPEQHLHAERVGESWSELVASRIGSRVRADDAAVEAPRTRAQRARERLHGRGSEERTPHARPRLERWGEDAELVAP